MTPPTADPADLRVIHLAPHAGSSGVGDYADDFAAAVAPHVREVVPFRHAAPRRANAREVRRERDRLAALVADTPGPRVVHAEMSGGAVVPFWALRGLRDVGVRVTATLHDPPRAVWYPFLTSAVSRGRVLNQAVHRPLHPLLERLERRTFADVDVVVLNAPALEATRALGLGRSVTLARHVLAAGPASPPRPASARPLAVGMYGHVYTGKGFDLLPALRRTLPDDVALRVAGRGTEDLPPVPGVEVLGPVEGDAEAAFFDSVRVLLMPYTRPPVGGLPMLPTSGAHLRALVHATPTVALASPATAYLAGGGLSTLVDGGPAELAGAADALARSASRLDEASARLAAYVAGAGGRDEVAPFLDLWSRAWPT